MAQMAVLSETGNERIAMGGNLPPDLMAFNSIDAYYEEAKNWASDGFAIDSQAQADEIDTLDKALLKLGQEADTLRIEEKRPLDEQIDAIQAKFNPYIQKGKGKVDVARSTLKALLTAWRVEQQRIKDEAARKVREEAAEAERLAQQAFAQTSVSDLAEREEAERLAERAANLAKQANKATKAATTGTGLRTSYMPVLTDRNAAIKHYWAKDPEAFGRLVLDMAITEVRQGAREIPGFRVEEVKGAI
jgi:hypothetical protein